MIKKITVVIPNGTKVKLIDIDRWSTLPGVHLTERINNFIILDVHYVCGNISNPLYRISNGEYSFWAYPKEISLLSEEIKTKSILTYPKRITGYIGIDLNSKSLNLLGKSATSVEDSIEKVKEKIKEYHDIYYESKEIQYLICEVVSTISLKKDFILQEIKGE